MRRYVEFVVRHRVAVVCAVLAITIALASQLRALHLEIRRRASLPQEHPYVQIQNRVSDLFGGEAIAIIGVVAANGTIFTPAILAKVQRITMGLLDTPGVVGTSLFSMAAPNVKAVVAGADGMMDIHPLMETLPTTHEEIERVKAAVQQDRLFRENLVSRDQAATVIVVEFDDRLTDPAIAQRIEEVVAPERDASVHIALAGAPILRAALARYTRLMGILFPIAVVVIGLIHYEAFRTLQAMFLPLVTALLSVIWALGIMGLSGQPMDTWSAVTPVVILAVAAGHAVQILKRYYEEYARVHDSHLAVINSVTAVGPVMLTAGLIASVGFGSLMTFGVTSVRVFGFLLASGILSALVIEMTFTPACRSLLPAPKRHEIVREGQVYWLDRGLDRLAGAVVARPGRVLLAATAIAVVAGAGAMRIQTDNSFRFWFSPSTQVRVDDVILNEKLPGTASVRILVEGQAENALQDPAVLRAMSDFERVMEAAGVGGVTSIADHVKRMHQAMNNGDPAFYAIPDNARLIAQYLFLYGMAAGPDGLSAFVDTPYQRAVIRGLSKSDGAAFSRDLIARLRRDADERFAGLPVTVGIAGGTIGVQTAMNDTVVHEKIVNMVQVSAIIFLLSALVLRSVVGGVFVLMPLAIAVAINLGVMGWARVWLDMTTAAITSMGVSIGADFAIYLIYRIREEVAAGGSLAGAVRASLHSSGKAIFFVSSAVALGYLVLPFAGFSIWTRLGLLTAIIVSVSALAAVTVIPALALVIEPRFLSHAAAAKSVSPARTHRRQASAA